MTLKGRFPGSGSIPTPSHGAVGELYAAALARYEAGDASAAALFDAVLAAYPAHVPARYKLANLHKEAGELDAAEAGYAEVLRRQPAHAEALNNLGAIHQLRGAPAAAETCYREAIASDPALPAPALNLGRLLIDAGRMAEAERVFADAQARSLDAGLFGHLRAAAGGGSGDARAGVANGAARAPESYVRETFDAFAGGFEQRLVGELDYRVPAQLVALARRRVGAAGGLDVLDLGCGTGLVGQSLERPGTLARSLVGIDLSTRMLDEARRKACYTSLQQADIAAWLAGAPGAHFDLVIAADVFIYFGELDAVFADVGRTLRAGGLFAFSVETTEQGRWQLLRSGRYAQSDAYIAELYSRHGLILEERLPVAIRRGVAGALFLLRKR
ncbi:MAG: methyltransferase domain-containing protein [Betaproteobacteria bacterium]|nr:methyltransferase domain-containing protein [Betaproteobacteria bacterium]